MINFIIVLGNSRQTIIKRLDRTIEEFYKIKQNEDEEHTYGINNYIILTGGNKPIKVNDKTYSTGLEYMFEYVSQKINPKYIIQENKSTNTVDNLLNSWEIIMHDYPKIIFGSDVDVTICTSSFHIKRCIILTTFLNAYNFNLKFIHTNEIVTIEDNKKELTHIDNFMNSYVESL